MTICLPVLNGARFLDAQLESLLLQTHPPARVIISDDGSVDETHHIIKRFQGSAPFPVQILAGPQRGYGANIMFLLSKVDHGFLAFCDQDDIWMTERLEQALDALSTTTGPALHVSARAIGCLKSHRIFIPRQTSFPRALRRNLAPANATVINPTALQLIRQAASRLTSPPAFPDWWIFALLLGRDGTVLFDPRPRLVYRQHGKNMLGARTVPGLARRAAALCDGRHRQWQQAHLQAIMECADLLTPDNRDILQSYTHSDGTLPDYMTEAI
ncbi:MAG: glycosyltransferase [Pseudomonadota bacterium]|nr:glycosyltransferase [Pseudomonadota bacterium]